MKTISLIVCTYLIVCCVGCASRPPLKHETLAKITEHQTTRTQVEELLGPPDGRFSDSSQRSLTVYEDNKAAPKLHLFKNETEYSYLRAFFLFEPEGVLSKKFVSETKTSAVMRFGVMTVGAPVSDEQLSKLKPLMTSTEVLALLGPPISEELTLDKFIIRRWAFGRQSLVSRMKMQIVNVVFEGDTDLVRDFTIRDDVPSNQKKAN